MSWDKLHEINKRKTASQLQSIFSTSLNENFTFKHGSESNEFEIKIDLFLEYEF